MSAWHGTNGARAGLRATDDDVDFIVVAVGVTMVVVIMAGIFLAHEAWYWRSKNKQLAAGQRPVNNETYPIPHVKAPGLNYGPPVYNQLFGENGPGINYQDPNNKMDTLPRRYVITRRKQPLARGEGGEAVFKWSHRKVAFREVTTPAPESRPSRVVLNSIVIKWEGSGPSPAFMLTRVTDGGATPMEFFPAAGAHTLTLGPVECADEFPNFGLRLANGGDAGPVTAHIRATVIDATPGEIAASELAKAVSKMDEAAAEVAALKATGGVGGETCGRMYT